MAYATISLAHPFTRQMRQAPLGFSWTTLFFGFFPALLRGHYAGALVIFLCGALSFGLANIVFAFIYNKMYLRNLVNEGFRASGDKAQIDALAARAGVMIPAMEQLA